MDAVFALEVSVCVVALDHNGCGFDAGLVAVQVIHHLVGEIVPLCPAGIHTVKHLRPVLGLGAARSGMDREDGIGTVILSGEQRGEARLLHLSLQPCKTRLHLWHQGVVLFLVAHFAQGHQIVPLAFPFPLRLQLVLQLTHSAGHLLGLLQVVPKAGRGAFRVQHIQLLLGGGQVQGLGQLVQGRLDVVQLYLVLVKLQHRSHAHFRSNSSYIISESPHDVKKNPPKRRAGSSIADIGLLVAVKNEIVHVSRSGRPTRLILPLLFRHFPAPPSVF